MVVVEPLTPSSSSLQRTVQLVSLGQSDPSPLDPQTQASSLSSPSDLSDSSLRPSPPSRLHLL